MSGLTTPSPPLPAKTAAYYAEGWWRRETFLDDLHRQARVRPGEPAYITVRDDDHCVTVTFAQLAEQVELLAAALWETGVRPGDLVAFHLPEIWETAALWLACGRVGAITLVLDHCLGGRERDLVLKGTPADLLITAADDDSAGVAATVGISDLLARAATLTPLEQGERPQVSADDLCQMLLTSGTGGRVKGVLHTFNSRYATVRLIARLLGRSEISGTSSEIGHSLGLSINVLAPLLTGRPSVFSTSKDPGHWLDLIERHRIACCVKPPLFWGQLVAAQRRRPRDLSSLSRVVSLAAALPASTAADIRDVLSPHLINAYGMSECGLISLSSPGDPAEDSIGRPVDGVEVELRQDEGTLHVRSPGLCHAMVDMRTGRCTWTPDTDEGWYDTGDLMRMGQDGRLHYQSRAVDRIGSTLLIPVAEVESELHGHPAVAEVAIVGIPDADGHEETCAVVVPTGTPPSLEDLRVFLRGRRMTEQYLPARLVISDSLPRTSLGKVRKTEVRDLIASGALTGHGSPLRHTQPQGGIA
ncbi:AMP-binding protein [Nonomuraea spiralis]|uniref:AMP-binding protein n=1 Tax=Nonomuraea spiralis TaxID=46182 RepID=UPI00378BEB82